MGCNAANMSDVNDLSYHSSVGPPSSLVVPFSWEVKESTTKLLHITWWNWEALWFLLQEKIIEKFCAFNHKTTLEVIQHYWSHATKSPLNPVIMSQHVIDASASAVCLLDACTLQAWKHILTFTGNVTSTNSLVSTLSPSYLRIWLEITRLAGKLSSGSSSLQPKIVGHAKLHYVSEDKF